MSAVEERYFNGSYLAQNPTWDGEDAIWKAGLVANLLAEHGIVPATICEVGCGTGDILARLADAMPMVRVSGYDISPQAASFWKRHSELSVRGEFHLGDFHSICQNVFDVLLMLDVFEHVRDPFSFLERSKDYATYFVFHIPLDLSAISIARGTPLTGARRRVGHLHYYTKDLALATLSETGYKVIKWRYTGASQNSPNRTWKTRLAAVPRRVARAIDPDFAVRLLGGETLLVLARPN